ncbi:hypothetical protein [Pseudomonas avellanae]|uniref:hypothetical protein n=1 Tax=Pseudomonas avellanae TaxID=46257 RepID=UPI003B50805B
MRCRSTARWRRNTGGGWTVARNTAFCHLPTAQCHLRPRGPVCAFRPGHHPTRARLRQQARKRDQQRLP